MFYQITEKMFWDAFVVETSELFWGTAPQNSSTNTAWFILAIATVNITITNPGSWNTTENKINFLPFLYIFFNKIIRGKQ